MASSNRCQDARIDSSLFWMSSDLSTWKRGGSSLAPVERDAKALPKEPSALLVLGTVDICIDALCPAKDADGAGSMAILDNVLWTRM